MLRAVRDRHEPSSLRGTDVINWLDEDLLGDVEAVTGPAEVALPTVSSADRVLMVEVMEHLESPWTILRAAARLVRPHGRLVVTTPHVANLRHRLELVVRGQLTSFRPDNQPHLTPVLPHVVRTILVEEGLSVSTRYGGVDLIPLTGGRRWPSGIRCRFPALTHRSVVMIGIRNEGTAR